MNSLLGDQVVQGRHLDFHLVDVATVTRKRKFSGPHLSDSNLDNFFLSQFKTFNYDNSHKCSDVFPIS